MIFTEPIKIQGRQGLDQGSQLTYKHMDTSCTHTCACAHTHTDTQLSVLSIKAQDYKKIRNIKASL